MLEHVVQIESALVEDHPSRLLLQRNLALAYKANGQIDETIELLEQIVHNKELTKDNPSRLGSLHVLADIYREKGQVEKAEALLST